MVGLVEARFQGVWVYLGGLVCVEESSFFLGLGEERLFHKVFALFWEGLRLIGLLLLVKKWFLLQKVVVRF